MVEREEAARPKQPSHLGNGQIRVGERHRPVVTEDGIEARVRERDGFRTGKDERELDAGLGHERPCMFELALRRAGATADRAVHVGDMYHVDVVGARAAGLSALLVDEANLKAGMDCRCIQSISELPLMM